MLYVGEGGGGALNKVLIEFTIPNLSLMFFIRLQNNLLNLWVCVVNSQSYFVIKTLYQFWYKIILFQFKNQLDKIIGNWMAENYNLQHLINKKQNKKCIPKL